MRAVLEWALDRRPVARARARDLARDVLGRARRRSREPAGSSGCSSARRTPSPALRAQALRALGGALRHLRRVRAAPALLSREPRAVHGRRRGARGGAHAVPGRREHGDERRARGRVAAARGVLLPRHARARPRRSARARRSASSSRRPTGKVTSTLAIALALESAAIAADARLDVVGGGPARQTPPSMERELGRLDDAERHALRVSSRLPSGSATAALLCSPAAELAIIAAASRATRLGPGCSGEPSRARPAAAASASGRATEPSSRRSCCASTAPSSPTPGQKAACCRSRRRPARARPAA